MIGYQDALIGLVLLVLLFGAKRLPELAGSLGQSMKEFKKAVSTDDGPPEPPGSPATAQAARACTACATPLEREWSHCPRCGAAAPSVKA